jgi:hypothetical protein
MLLAFAPPVHAVIAWAPGKRPHRDAGTQRGIEDYLVLVSSAAWEKRDGAWKALLHHATEPPS